MELKATVKKAMFTGQSDNMLILEVWKSQGLQGQIGGVAFSNLKHFVDNGPKTDSITRIKRMIENENFP